MGGRDSGVPHSSLHIDTYDTSTKTMLSPSKYYVLMRLRSHIASKGIPS